MPPPYVQRAFRGLVDAGADLVVGHHPHVPQGVEIYHGRPIVYSVGNFALWQPNGGPFRRLGYLVKGLFHGAELGSVEIVPYRIYADRLALLKDDARRAFLADLACVSGPLGDAARVEDAWRAYAVRWLDDGLAEELTAFASLLLDEVDLRAAWLGALSGRGDVRARLARRIARILSGWAARLAGGPFGQAQGRQGGRDQAQGAAMLRNRFDTLAHRELYLTALRNGMNEERGSELDWAFDLIERWGVFAR